MINVVNEIINENRGWVSHLERKNNQFEIRIELARELKQSRDERKSAFEYLNIRENENKDIILAIENLHLKATQSRIHKYRMFFENTENASSVNSTCLYCGKGF